MKWLFKKHYPITSDFRAHLQRIPPSRAPGIDIAARTGTPVHAPATGKVLDVRWSEAGGLSIWIRHGPKTQTYYAHLSCVMVGRGQRVVQGQPIAEVGSTGNSTGPHLHFSVRREGQWVNPLPVLEPEPEPEPKPEPEKIAA